MYVWWPHTQLAIYSPIFFISFCLSLSLSDISSLVIFINSTAIFIYIFYVAKKNELYFHNQYFSLSVLQNLETTNKFRKKNETKKTQIDKNENENILKSILKRWNMHQVGA